MTSFFKNLTLTSALILFFVGCQKTSPLQFNDSLTPQGRTSKPVSCTTAFCENEGEGESDPSATPETWFAQLNREIFKPKCAGCHSGLEPKAGIDLSSYEKMLANPHRVVVPGKPDESALYNIIADGVMPPPSEEQVSPADAERIRLWIGAGASKTALPPNPDIQD